MTASGSQIEDGGTAHCTCTLGSISVEGLYHAQDFGLFTVSNGQLTQSTLTINGNIATTTVDGVIKSSDLVGGSITVTGTILGVTDAGAIATPTVTLSTPSGNVLEGVMTQPLSETNPNGDFPSYSFTAEWPLKADSN
jgi:predicted transcriptional regulator